MGLCLQNTILFGYEYMYVCRVGKDECNDTTSASSFASMKSLKNQPKRSAGNVRQSKIRFHQLEALPNDGLLRLQGSASARR